MRPLSSRLSLSVISAIVLVALAGCASTSAPQSTKVTYGNGVKVSGVINARERVKLQPNSVVIARLVDVTNPKKPVVIAEQTISRPGQLPVPFVLTAGPKKIDDNHNYSVEATIGVGKQVAWRTNQQYGVITRGNPINGLMVWVQQVD